jgi:hypothetical protein
MMYGLKTVILTDFSQLSAYVLLNITESSGLQDDSCVKPLAGVPYFDVVVGRAWSHDADMRAMPAVA